MSALDRAFIKAHGKEPGPRAAKLDERPAPEAAEPGRRSDRVAPAAAGGPNERDPEYRFDGAHAVRRGPYVSAGPGAPIPRNVDPALVGADSLAPPSPPGDGDDWMAPTGKLHQELPPGPRPEAEAPAAPVTISAAGDSRMASARLELPLPSAPVLAPPPSLPTPAEMSTAAAPGDQPAAAKPAWMLAGAEPELDAEATFAPDWEVDRLAWPAVCEGLLETEARYFRSVGQRLKDATQDSHHVVMITGARRGEGRTTLAMCLTRCAAQAGVAVALVDADLANPQLGRQLGMETPCGWLEVVAGKAPLSEAAVSSLEDGLTLFPLSQPEDQESPADDSSLRAVLRAIAVHFPLVIVDAGPLTNDDRLPLADRKDCPIDTAIVVRDLRNTTEKKTLATARLLQRRGVPAVGIAENFRDPD